MANLSRENSKWKGSQTQTKKSASYSFPTGGKYVDNNIELSVTVPGINLNKSETFYVNDGIYTWNWEVDASGNVLIY